MQLAKTTFAALTSPIMNNSLNVVKRTTNLNVNEYNFFKLTEVKASLKVCSFCSLQDTQLRRSQSKTRSRSLSPTKLSRSLSGSELTAQHDDKFLVKRKDDKTLQNRDFSSFTRPKPRRSKSPTRTRRSISPNRSFGLGSATVEPLPCMYF